MHVLLCLDGSPPSVLARDLVASLSWREGTQITLLAAYDASPSWFGGGPAMARDAEKVMRDRLGEELRQLSEPLSGRGWSVAQHLVRGRAATTIVDSARDRGVDLIVTGSRGHGVLGSMLLGSVAAEVASTATCAVLVVRRPRVSRIVVATDGSPAARAIPKQLARWDMFRRLTAEAVAVSVSDTPTLEPVVPARDQERLVAQRRDMRAHYLTDAEEMAEHLVQIGLPTTALVRGGDPAYEIIDVAEAHQADLIVTGTRGLSGIDRLLLGSVARNVLTHAKCSVLVLREAPSSIAGAVPVVS